MSASRVASCIVTATMLLLAASCGGKSDTPEGSESAATESAQMSADPSATTSEAAALTPAQAELIQRAVKLSRAIQSDPDAAVSLLAEQGLSPEEWSQMLEDIARDPVLAAAYEAGMK